MPYRNAVIHCEDEVWKKNKEHFAIIPEACDISIISD